MNNAYETITRIKMGSFSVRVWRQETEFKMGADEEVCDVLSKLPRRVMGGGKHFPEDIMAALQDMPRVTTIEISDQYSQGCTLYPNRK